MKKGEVWRVRIPPAPGHAQIGERPAIILQELVFNNSLPTTLIVPLSSKLAASRFDGTLVIQPDQQNGLYNRAFGSTGVSNAYLGPAKLPQTVGVSRRNDTRPDLRRVGQANRALTVSSLSSRQHAAFANPAKMACRHGNLRVLPAAAYRRWDRVVTMTQGREVSFMSITIPGVVTNGVVVPDSALPEGARVEIHVQPARPEVQPVAAHRSQAELLADLRRRSHAPPSGTPDTVELLRQDRER